MKNIENKKPWYADESGFFSKWYFEIVTKDFSESGTNKEIDFLKKVLRLKKGAKVLDLCCGYGRITNELASRGYDMTGQDLNNYFLGIAKKNADKMKLNILWVKSDMRRIPFKNKFDAVINMFTSFGYFSNDEEDETVIKQVNKALKKGGKFLLDYVNKDFIIRRYLKEDIREIKDGYVKIKRDYDHLRSSHHEKFEIFVDGKIVKKFTVDFRFYSVTELIAMIHKNGFKIINVFGDFNFNPLSFDSKNCIILAKKI
jgi:SAM-dependent methyltransferase